MDLALVDWHSTVPDSFFPPPLPCTLLHPLLSNLSPFCIHLTILVNFHLYLNRFHSAHSPTCRKSDETPSE